jgi:hypothetical protein
LNWSAFKVEGFAKFIYQNAFVRLFNQLGQIAKENKRRLWRWYLVTYLKLLTGLSIDKQKLPVPNSALINYLTIAAQWIR